MSDVINREGLEGILDKDSKEYKLFKQQLDDNLSLFLTKNHDYGDSFFKTWYKMKDNGILSAYSRISDKFNRFEHYILNLRNKEGYVCDESVIDTLLDMANYAIMTTVAIKIKSLPSEEPKADNSTATDTTDIVEPEDGWKERTVNKPASVSSPSLTPTPEPSCQLYHTADLPTIPRRTTGGDF